MQGGKPVLLAMPAAARDFQLSPSAGECRRSPFSLCLLVFSRDVSATAAAPALPPALLSPGTSLPLPRIPATLQRG